MRLIDADELKNRIEENKEHYFYAFGHPKGIFYIEAFDAVKQMIDRVPSARPTGDLISRDATYQVLTDYYHHRTDAQHEALRDALSRVPSADRWIPCSERLPEDNSDVLVTIGGMRNWVTVDNYEEYSTYYAFDVWGSKVIAWMPLPEPYEGVTE